MNMQVLKVFVLIVLGLCVALRMGKGKNDARSQRRNENKRLKRKAEALMIQRLKAAKATLEKTEKLRQRKRTERATKIRENVKKRYVHLMERDI